MNVIRSDLLILLYTSLIYLESDIRCNGGRGCSRWWLMACGRRWGALRSDRLGECQRFWFALEGLCGSCFHLTYRCTSSLWRPLHFRWWPWWGYIRLFGFLLFISCKASTGLRPYIAAVRWRPDANAHGFSPIRSEACLMYRLSDWPRSIDQPLIVSNIYFWHTFNMRFSMDQ